MDTDAVVERISSVIWGPWTVALVLLAGIWFSAGSGFFQISGARLWWRETVGSLGKGGFKGGDGGISPLQSATAALAGTLGTGNIVGVAAAMTLGGPGAVFWMWIAAFFGMMTAFAENTLGVLYRVRDEKGEWLGGPMLYMEKGLNAKPLAVAWAIACAVAAFGVGNLTQVNSIAQSASSAWGVPPWATGAVVTLFAAPAILGGVKSVARFTEKLVPAMAALYYIGCIAVLAVNAPRLPAAFGEIFSGIFSPSAVGGGALGAMLVGVRRGVFTNEAGLGSAVMVHAAADCKSPAVQGMWGAFEVFFDTIVTCTLTALAVLVSGAMEKSDKNGLPLDGAQLSAAAFDQIFGSFSGSFVTIALLLFAFATVVAWSCYGERAFGYLCGARRAWLYRLAYVLAIIPGCFVRVRTVWALSDVLNGLMAIPNTIAILLLWSRAKEQLELARAAAEKPRRLAPRLFQRTG